MDLFEQINNAVLDLQAAQLQSYERPLRALGRLLQHDDLHRINSQLLENVDLEDFLKRSSGTGGSMVGSVGCYRFRGHRPKLLELSQSLSD